MTATSSFFAARRITPDRLLSFAPMLLLLVAFLLGGISGYYPVRARVIELLAVWVLVLILLNWRGPSPTRDATLGIILVLGLPLLQLIPLPPALWMALPGREVQSEIAAFIDPGMWQPVSLNASATLRTWLSLLAPVAMFLAMLQISPRERAWYGWAVLGIAALSTVFGLVQVAAGGPYLFKSAHNNFAVGLFANRNHQAALGYVGAIFAASLAMRSNARRSGHWIAAVAIGMVLVAATLATESRMGVALLVVGLICSGLVLFHRTRTRMVVLGVVVVVVSVLLIQYSQVGRTVAARFALASSDERSVYWPEVIYGIKAYFPAGAGLGTFASSYQSIEPLGSVVPDYLNHAHNEYLELAMEAGIVGIAALVIFLVTLAWRARGILRATRLDDSTLIARTALIAAVALILHSIADYPIRTYALLTLFGMLLGMVWAPSRERKTRPEPARVSGAERRPSPLETDADMDLSDAPARSPLGISRPILQALLVGMGLSLTALILGLGITDIGKSTPYPQDTLQEGVMTSTDAAAAQAEAAADHGEMKAAQSLAVEALQMSLQNARALRVIGRVASSAGQVSVADTAMTLAARLGWRDGFAQLWLFDRALQQQDYATAAQAGDALMRTNFHPDLVMPRMQRLLGTPPGRTALAGRMAENPPWTVPFLAFLSGQMPGSTQQVALLLEEMGRAGKPPSASDIRRFFDAAIAGGQAFQLVGAWQQLNGGITDDPRTGIIDGNFDMLAAREVGSADNGPFGWKITNQSDATITTPQRSDGNAGPALHISMPQDSTGGSAVSQLLVLPAGRYRLTYLASLERGSASAFRLEVQCQGGPVLVRDLAIKASGKDWSPERFVFEVPSKCNSERLSITVSAAFGEAEAGFDEVEISHQ